MISVQVMNLGKYNEGFLVGDALKLPSDTETVQALFGRIGLDGIRYEGFYIDECETNVRGLSHYISDEYANIDELNYLASTLENLDEYDLSKFEAALEIGDSVSSIKDLINLARNLDCYDFHPGIEDEESLGYYLADECCTVNIPDEIKDFFDYEAYGLSYTMSCSCAFSNHGFVENNGESFVERYSSLEDLPEESRIVAYPSQKHSILENLKKYKQEIGEVTSGNQRCERSSEIDY